MTLPTLLNKVVEGHPSNEGETVKPELGTALRFVPP